MTVRRGEEWGERVDRPAGLVVAASDAELAALVGSGSSSPLTVATGDVRRTLGAATDGSTVQRIALDVLRVEADGVGMCAVAHVVARRSWWRGRIVGVFNVEHVGNWDVAPRGHPNDGRAEILEVEPAMSWRARCQAWRRLPSGTHLPHPAILVRALTPGAAVTWEFSPALTLYVDGRRHGSVRRLAVTIDPDAYVLHV